MRGENHDTIHISSHSLRLIYVVWLKKRDLSMKKCRLTTESKTLYRFLLFDQFPHHIQATQVVFKFRLVHFPVNLIYSLSLFSSATTQP
uniref:Uncharacterized protein n=1 Tax=Lotus japonicus TaxID=34305 RepID=I3TA80_LOTJA|nr:unknown [Lotus japonicus]